MNKTLAITDGYALIVEVWVVFADVRYYCRSQPTGEQR
jgi:hypothetical protein